MSFVVQIFLTALLMAVTLGTVVTWRLTTNSQPKIDSGPKTLLIVLGSGGHTGEMLRLLRAVQLNKYRRRIWVYGQGDEISAKKAAQYELSQGNKTGFEILSTPRAREVGQSWSSTVFTSLRSLISCFSIVARNQPHVIVVNGPGTCVMVCLASTVLKIFMWSRARIIFFESLARVHSLSLSGRLLLHFADRFVVQWPELCKKYPQAEYFGMLV